MISQDIIDQLENVSISELPKYLKCGKDVLKTIQEVGVKTLNDLWYQDFNQFTKDNGYRYFPLKSAKNIQTNIKNFSEEQLCDIIFWNKKHIFPSEYKEGESLERNLISLRDELIAHIGECQKREKQIKLQNDKKRIVQLLTILKGLYTDGKSRESVAKEIHKDCERVRQIILPEFITLLRNGEAVKYEALKNIAINEKVVEKVRDIRENRIFEQYNIKDEDKCINTFFEDFVGLDILEHEPFSFLVPAREKGVYKYVIRAFFDEMTEIMEGMPAKTLAEIISNSNIVQRDIVNNGKSYDETFVYQLLYNENITIISEDSNIIIKPEYIVNFGTDGLGDIHQERALARIMADKSGSWMSREKIAEEYNRRYNRTLNADQVNLTTTEKYGCKPSGRNGLWRYCKTELSDIRQWIEAFALDKTEGFSMTDIIDALKEADYAYNSEATIRTYITRCCAVHNNDNNYFCHRDHIAGNSPEWRKKTSYGLTNWLANEIHLLFNQQQVDSLDHKTICNYLVERSKGTTFDENYSSLKNSCYFLFSQEREDNPFVLSSHGWGEWALSKREGVYEGTDWLSYGLKGRSYQRKIINEATHIIRKKEHGQISLGDLVDQLLIIIGDDIYDDEAGKVLTQRRLRKKLIEFINNNELNHPLKLVKVKSLFVKLDARLINEQERYKPQDKNTVIRYCTISQLAEFNSSNDEYWDLLKSILQNELSFCERWFEDDRLNIAYKDAVDNWIHFIRSDKNKNLSEVVPQRLYEFFSVSNPTSIDRYCIMCSIAKNFEGFIDRLNARYKYNSDKNANPKGLYEKVELYKFEDFRMALHDKCDINNLEVGSYKHTLKNLNSVRNTDSHGKWYTDRKATDNCTEDERNIEKIRRFAALYIFTYAKYAMQCNDVVK